VEVSGTSLRLDRGRKARLYARAGIAEYWIVNLVDSQLEVFRDPQPDSQKPRRHVFATKIIRKPPEIVTPLAASHSRIAVKDLLP
jgi:Uma2 family endonuclease